MAFTRTVKRSLPGTTPPFRPDAAEARGTTVPVPAGRIPGTTFPTPGPAIGSPVTPCGCTGTPSQNAAAACGCTAPSAPIGARGVLASSATTSESASVPPSRNGMTVPIYTPLAGAVRPVAPPPGFAGTSTVPRNPRVRTTRPPSAITSWGAASCNGATSAGTADPATGLRSECGFTPASSTLRGHVRETTTYDGFAVTGAPHPNERPPPTAVHRTTAAAVPGSGYLASVRRTTAASQAALGLTVPHTLRAPRPPVLPPTRFIGDRTRPRPPDVIPTLPVIPNNVVVSSGPTATFGNELSLTSVPTLKGPPILFASYNAGGPTIGIARSTDEGRTWTSAATPMPTLALSDGRPWGGCIGDTWCTGTGIPNVVAVTGVIGSSAARALSDVGLWTGNVNETIALTASFDASTAIRVSESNCNNTDGPKIVSDDENRTLWVWWFSGQGGNTNWIRKFSLSEKGVPAALTPPIQVPNLKVAADRTLGAILHASFAIRRRGKDESPWLFLICASAGMGPLNDCSMPGNQQTVTVEWYMIYSKDEGKTWSAPELIIKDSTWPTCIGLGLTANRSFASAVYDHSSDRLLVTLNASATRVDGEYVGTRAMAFQWPSSDGRGHGFDMWVPPCNPAACPGEDAPCLVAGKLPANETFCHQYGPSIHVVPYGGESRALFVWYDTRDSALPHPNPGDARSVNQLETDIWAASFRPGAPYDFQPRTLRRVTSRSSGASEVPWPTAAFAGPPSGANTWWGDYSSGVTPLQGRFFIGWADMRASRTATEIRGTLARP
jgi:hypothetical protein